MSSPTDFSMQYSSMMRGSYRLIWQNDPVIQLMHQAIRAEKTHTLKAHLIDMDVHAYSHSESLLARPLGHWGVKLYVFREIPKPQKEDFCKLLHDELIDPEADSTLSGPTHRVLPVSITFGVSFDYLQPEDVLVRLGCKWVPFPTWLRSLPCPDFAEHRLRGALGIKNQRQWYLRNPSKADFFKLPLEIRQMVYLYVLGPKNFPQVERYSEGKIEVLQFGDENTYFHDPDVYTMEANLFPHHKGMIILTCSQIYKEAMTFAWEVMHSCFGNPTRLEEAAHFYRLYRVVATNPLQLFTNIRLDMPSYLYFELFGICVSTHSGRRYTLSRWPYHPVHAVAFSMLPNLKRLELYFQDPFARGQVDDAFGHYARITNRPSTFSRAWSCQRVTQDWILTFAKQYIQQVPTILLTGFIKRSIKEKWVQIHKDEREGIHWDESSTLDAIINTGSASLPPACNCTKSCALYHMDPYDDYEYPEYDRIFDFEE